MKAAILTILILLAVGFFLKNVLSFLKIMFSAKKKSFRADNIIERTKGFFVYVIGQKRILKNYTWAGVEHFMIFWGFMIITVGSLEHIVLGFVPGFEIFGFLGGNAKATFLLILDIAFLILDRVKIYLIYTALMRCNGFIKYKNLKAN